MQGMEILAIINALQSLDFSLKVILGFYILEKIHGLYRMWRRERKKRNDTRYSH